TSRFGAWLDVAVDNLGRGMLWSLLFKWGWMVSALEWCVFMYNHSTRGEQWNSFGSSPPLVQAVTANGNPPATVFRTPLGVWVVGGLHCLPVWLYACQWGVLSHWLELPLWIQHVGMLLLAAGRVLEVFGMSAVLEHLHCCYSPGKTVYQRQICET
uniref:Uncharacterized protein n=1 Tax=Oreochromis aureus TaxID=47969 RepID=A0AAZ1Y3I7_OREAU